MLLRARRPYNGSTTCLVSPSHYNRVSTAGKVSTATPFLAFPLLGSARPGSRPQPGSKYQYQLKLRLELSRNIVPTVLHLLHLLWYLARHRVASRDRSVGCPVLPVSVIFARGSFLPSHTTTLFLLRVRGTTYDKHSVTVSCRYQEPCESSQGGSSSRWVHQACCSIHLHVYRAEHSFQYRRYHRYSQVRCTPGEGQWRVNRWPSGICLQ
jgi:hypothetical protein